MWVHNAILDSCFVLQESFAKAKNWVKELQRQASPNIVIALSGNKADLANKRVVEYETSAKTAMNVNDIFLAIAKKLPKGDGSGGGPSGRGREGIDIGQEGGGQGVSSGSCSKKLPKGDGSGGGPSGRGREGIDIGQDGGGQGVSSGSC
ncbi:unnamed protein product [Gongylonema pulchrum]|uniref:Ras-related protein Rab-11A n=1 Tax=Gongylonema pulchrum TaxID=637853 RepID=A0A183DUY6_9BILA|nr:unnamed protein product [Gongylonema pulchrum]